MLPDNKQRIPSHVIGDGDSTSLGKAFKPQLEQHPTLSGVRLLGNGLDAFVGRVVSAHLAERSIDLQSYMFHQDTVGRLLIRELVAAADRGVRVRMLIDDIYGAEADDVWSALDAHPNVEVRLFNPFERGHSKYLQFITRLKTVNHRMHSKSILSQGSADSHRTTDTQNLASAKSVRTPSAPHAAWASQYPRYPRLISI